MFHLANILTLSRIALIPLFIATFYFPGAWGHWVGLGLFVLAGVTDFLDGYVARSQNLVSAMGRFLDPIADKLLVAAAIIMLVAFSRINGLDVLAAVVILSREIFVSGLREFLAELKVGVPVSQLAKWKTTVQIFALSFLIIGKAAPFGLPAADIGTALLWIAAILTIYTGYDYLRAGLKYMT
ncbi:CDP-diacylglycerol--glycerol-3-phosphate 3-phosphatidyltransferase [Govanella unica]|uniref:CDP-diacylglycerol--glycerol-3-phosphate 3-phosphatidyltransferase n=1 Tax=Govanella unica TaxID=2975056 RepID=A0A9X3TZS9_9PROT|nr:CDP-diacylglycerol--glycerol-3-phosphate 3-phosphatidyltransferase [Govania unica]MDA5194786.1 CDP-diacylglycerol--glycerol-3-phosphate 3-phosphatidyltransferase [Govania unica]